MIKKRYYYLPVFFIFLFFALGIFLPYNIFQNNASQLIFTVPKGEGSKEISVNLEKKGLIWWGPFFRIYVLLNGKQGKLQSGSYQISPSMNIPAIAKKFVSGDVMAAKITFPEGFNAEQIYQKLSGIAGASLADLKEYEGYLFPDTYQILYGAGSQEIIKLMTGNFDEKILGLESEIARQGKTLNDIVIMASILEKEVKTKEEKELAAGLLWKRLRAGMPLQVDAAPETYKTRGLPENPICNPGLESITAAVYPKASQYWYYLSTPEGITIFSKTLKDHNIARAKYLK